MQQLLWIETLLKLAGGLVLITAPLLLVKAAPRMPFRLDVGEEIE